MLELFAHDQYVSCLVLLACIHLDEWKLQNIHDIAQEAIENARFVCEEHYALFKGPPVELICPKDITIPYVPGHL